MTALFTPPVADGPTPSPTDQPRLSLDRFALMQPLDAAAYESDGTVAPAAGEWLALDGAMAVAAAVANPCQCPAGTDHLRFATLAPNACAPGYEWLVGVDVVGVGAGGTTTRRYYLASTQTPLCEVCHETRAAFDEPGEPVDGQCYECGQATRIARLAPDARAHELARCDAEWIAAHRARILAEADTFHMAIEFAPEDVVVRRWGPSMDDGERSNLERLLAALAVGEPARAPKGGAR